MHRLILNAPENMEVDHINGNRLDNRRENLRLCNSSQNKCNRGPRKDNKSGYKGVSWHGQRQKWTVRIKTPYGKYLSLGLYDDKKEAAMAYNKASVEYHGEFAFINKLQSLLARIYGQYGGWSHPLHLPPLLVTTNLNTMAKETVKVEKSDRQARWEAYVKAYAISNPKKYAQKVATEVEEIGVDGKPYTIKKKNEFEEIPESFK